MRPAHLVPFLPVIAFSGGLLNIWAFNKGLHKQRSFADKPWKRFIIMFLCATPYAYFISSVMITLLLYGIDVLSAAVAWVRYGDP